MSGTALLHRPALLLAAWMLVMSLLLFAAMGLDKRRAKGQRRRIPEARLFLLAALGGAAGGWLGMRLFHHKTLHRRFALGFPALALAQLALCAYLLIRGGVA